MEINYNQVLSELNNKINEHFTLRKGIGKNEMKDEEMTEEKSMNLGF